MGAIAMASVVAALFFLRFWRDTGDRLFLIFAAAFFLLAATRVGLAMSHVQQEGQYPLVLGAPRGVRADSCRDRRQESPLNGRMPSRHAYYGSSNFADFTQASARYVSPFRTPPQQLDEARTMSTGFTRW